MQPTVDILLATYNGERFLSAQIDSLLQQTYAHVRILISDDGSTDQTIPILQNYVKRFPEKIFLLPSKGRQGINLNFSYLLGNSSHPYVMFSDQDDVWLPHKVEITLQKMQQYEHRYGASTPLLVHTDLKVVDQDLNLLHPSFWAYSHLFPKTASSFHRLLGQNIVTGCTIMLNDALKQRAIPIPTEAIMHDWWLALAAAAFGRIGMVEEATILYRQHQRNTIGASQFTLFDHFKKQLRVDHTKRDSFKEKNRSQTTAFLARYQDTLPQSFNETLNAYLRFLDANYWKKIPLALRYGFLKNGIARNLIRLLPHTPSSYTL